VGKFFTEIKQKISKTRRQIEYPNIKSAHSFEVVTSGGTWVKATELKDRNPCTQRGGAAGC
jgi:hypothetical protein